MYKIKEYSFKKADDLNVIIKPSKRKNKKIDVYDKENKFIVAIDNNKYKDFPTYIDEKGMEFAKERRRLYKKRHEKDSNKAGFYAMKILW